MDSVEQIVLLAFVERYQLDLAAGEVAPLLTYLEAWPGYEEQIAREYLALQERAAGSDEDENNEDRVGPFRLIKLVGSGGQADVWSARDTRLDRLVALKVLRGGLAEGKKLLTRFQREAAITGALNDPGICPVYDVGVDGVPWIAMRFIEGRTLSEILRGRGDEFFLSLSDGVTPDSRPTPLTGRTDEILDLFEQIARSLQVAHDAGVIHRDIKPGNLMITDQGRPVIVDFGMARIEEGAMTLTASDQLIGTPIYMAPEQVRGEKVDRRADVYALGVTLYEALTGERPFARPTVESTYHAILNETPTRPRQIDATISASLETVLETAMAKEPHRRYATAEALADDIERLRRREPILARRPNALARGWLWSRRHPAAAALIMALTLGLPTLTGLGVYLQISRDEVEASQRYIEDTRDEVLAQQRLEEARWLERQLAGGMQELWHGNKRVGLQMLVEASDRFPADHTAVALRAFGLVILGRIDEARAWMRGRPAKDFALALELVDKARADKPLPERIESPARTAADHYLSGVISLERGHATQTVQDYREALVSMRLATLMNNASSLNSLSGQAHALLHLAGLGQPLVDREVRVLAVELETRWPEAWVGLYYAGRLMLLIDQQRGLDLLDAAWEIAPNGEGAALRLELARQIAKTDLERSIRMADEVDPDQFRPRDIAVIRRDMGIAALRQKRVGRALSLLQKSAEWNDQDPQTWYSIGLCHQERREFPKAIAAYDRSIALRPSPVNRAARAHTLLLINRWQEAADEARRALAEPKGNDPEAPARIAHAHDVLAICAEKEQRISDAIGHLEAAFEHSHRPVLLRLMHLSLLVLENRREDALVAAQEAVALHPKSALARFGLGYAKFELGEFSTGLTEMAAAMKQGPESPPMIARMMSRAGHRMELEVRRLAKAGKVPAASALLDEVASQLRHPEILVRCYSARLSNFALGKRDEALLGLAAIAGELRPAFMPSLLSTADACHAIGMKEGALALLEATIRRMKKDGLSKNQIPALETKRDTWREALPGQ